MSLPGGVAPPLPPDSPAPTREGQTCVSALFPHRTARAGTKVPASECRKTVKTFLDGKEESYERNPGRVPFVFNHKFLKRF